MFDYSEEKAVATINGKTLYYDEVIGWYDSDGIRYDTDKQWYEVNETE